MNQVEEGVNIEHLLVEAMLNMEIPLPDDPLPSAEEIAGAKAAVATAHSTCSAAAVPSQSIKGLGGAGLNLKRKGGSKAGNSSTISAATAPPALLGSRPAPGHAAPGGAGSALSSGTPSRAAAPKIRTASASSTTSTAASAPPAAAAAAAAAAAEEKDGVSGGRADASLSGVRTPEGDRSITKDGAGVRSFRTVLTPNSEGSEEWETDNSEEIKAVPTAAPKAVGSTSASSSGGSSSSWGASISSMLEEFADPSTLAFCGVVLGACASALLVLGASAYLKSRQ